MKTTAIPAQFGGFYFILDPYRFSFSPRSPVANVSVPTADMVLVWVDPTPYNPRQGPQERGLVTFWGFELSCDPKRYHPILV